MCFSYNEITISWIFTCIFDTQAQTQKLCCLLICNWERVFGNQFLIMKIYRLAWKRKVSFVYRFSRMVLEFLFKRQLRLPLPFCPVAVSYNVAHADVCLLFWIYQSLHKDWVLKFNILIACLFWSLDKENVLVSSIKTLFSISILYTIFI